VEEFSDVTIGGHRLDGQAAPQEHNASEKISGFRLGKTLGHNGRMYHRHPSWFTEETGITGALQEGGTGDDDAF
jgi:hypothetical protein